MKYPFLPDGSVERPIIDFRIGDSRPIKLLGLVDSGAVATRVNASVALALDIDLSTGADAEFRVAGGEYAGKVVNVPLTVGRIVWTAPVCFVDGWDFSYQLLGLRGFFDRWVVRIDAAEGITQLQPSRRPTRL